MTVTQDTTLVVGFAALKRTAYELLTRMRRCGVSRYHPDPLAAIEEASCRAHDRFR